MKLDVKAQKTLEQLLASGTGKPNAGGMLFGTIAIFEAGRVNGMKYRVIKETIMTDKFRVGYGKYDLYALKREAGYGKYDLCPITQDSNTIAEQPRRACAAKKTASPKPTKPTKSPKSPKKELTEDQKLKKLIKDSANWEVVYDSATDETLQRNW